MCTSHSAVCQGTRRIWFRSVQTDHKGGYPQVRKKCLIICISSWQYAQRAKISHHNCRSPSHCSACASEWRLYIRISHYRNYSFFFCLQFIVKLKDKCASSSPSLRFRKLFPICKTFFLFKDIVFCFIFPRTFSFLIQNCSIVWWMHNSQKHTVKLKKRITFAAVQYFI